jgi:hypothetical protein
MKRFYFLLLGFVLFIISCDEMTNKEKLLIAPGPDDSVYAVQHGPFHFSMKLPKKMVEESMPIILFKENTGDLVIALGENIHLKVSQQIKDLRMLSNDIMLSDADFYLIEKVEQNAEELVYKQMLPDNSFSSYHYKAMVSKTDLPYFIETDESRMYTKSDIDIIRAIAQSLAPL